LGVHLNLTAHGFRSTFSDWAAERTGYPREVVEMALAHAIGNKAEAACRRGDLFEKRRKLMEAWANFCEAPPAGEVVPYALAHNIGLAADSDCNATRLAPHRPSAATMRSASGGAPCLTFHASSESGLAGAAGMAKCRLPQCCGGLPRSSRASNGEPPAPDYLRLLSADIIEGGLPDLGDKKGQAEVDAAIGEAELMILDNISTLVRCGKEKEAESWFPVQGRAPADLRSVLLIHHAGKGGLQRGTSRREDVLDTVITLRRPADYAAD